MAAAPTALTLLLGLLMAAVAGGGPAAAASVVESERVRAEMIAETPSISAEPTLWVSLRLDLRPGWHTYWQNPGDSGEPTRIAWRLPAGVEASAILWAPPKRIAYGPLVNFGYQGRVDHLVRLTLPPDWPADAPLEVEADATWLVCEQICVPEEGSFRLRWAPASAGDPPDPGRIAEFDRLRATLPAPPPWPVAGHVANGNLVLSASPPGGGASVATVGATFFPYEWGFVEPSGRQELTRSGDGGLRLALERGERTPEALAGVLVLSQQTDAGIVERAFDVAAAIQPAPAAAGIGSGATGADPATGSDFGLARAMLLAFLGGLILNLMPCVFPVLSVKAIGLVHHGATSPGARRRSGLAYTLGVLSFMALVAVLLVLLKSAGAQIGWGFQLQSPAFVSVMAVILFVLGLSLAGWYSFGASVMGWGTTAAARSDGFGSFVTGALAALVATPCTAPFMGTAVGFALTQPWTSAVTVMLALGFGLALPYLLLTWLPGLARWLPHPGPWMERLKQFLAFPLFASVAWLIWVLAVQVGPSGVLAALMALVAAALAIWVGQLAGERPGVRATAAALAIAALALAAAPEALPPANGPVAAAVSAAEIGVREEPFSQQRLDRLREAGTPVFVNMTAAWCITCKLNEQVALASERVARAFAEGGFVYLKGDWTNRNPEITRFLQDFGRSGVPLYVVYPGDGRPPAVLPQLLTEAIVLEAVGGPDKLTATPSTTERTY